MRHIIPISGKDSLATAIVQRTRQPELAYEYIYHDTTMELPETYTWLDKVESTLHLNIVRMGKSLETIIHEQGFLPGPSKRYCTKYSKIFPMNKYIGKDKATIYLGIRADEERVGGKETRRIKCAYPLIELGIDLKLVYQIVEQVKLRPPTFFWVRLFEDVSDRLGDQQFVITELPQYLYDRAFAWRSRPNCFMCFFQRRYEWVGLLEHHPELFERAEKLEKDVGDSSERARAYYFIAKEMPLSRIREEAERIYQSRVTAVCEFLSKRLQGVLYAAPLIDELDMAQTSCGLYCGK